MASRAIDQNRYFSPSQLQEFGAPAVGPTGPCAEINWVRYRPAPTNPAYELLVQVGVAEDSQHVGGDSWKMFLIDYHRKVAEAAIIPSPPLTARTGGHSRWVSILAAMTIVAFLASPLLIFWDVKAAVLMTIMSLIAISMVANIGERRQSISQKNDVHS